MHIQREDETKLMGQREVDPHPTLSHKFLFISETTLGTHHYLLSCATCIWQHTFVFYWSPTGTTILAHTDPFAMQFVFKVHYKYPNNILVLARHLGDKSRSGGQTSVSQPHYELEARWLKKKIIIIFWYKTLWKPKAEHNSEWKLTLSIVIREKAPSHMQ